MYHVDDYSDEPNFLTMLLKIQNRNPKIETTVNPLRLRIFASLRYAFLLLLVIVPFAPTASAQDQCPTADTISYPVDTNLFRLAQDYGVASPRHQGRFHTGEDWFLAAGQSLGQPVRAAASGVVTYSAPTGWGRDGGAIILQHTFEDGTIIYTQYGHIAENDNVTFPARFSCVEAGQIIAVIGDVRPAPHLHFEIRVASDGTPGPGYSREDPYTLGWRRPAQYIANLRAWMQPSHRWHVVNSTFYPTVPPLLFNDNSMMVIDGALLRGITYDGRVLWRAALESPAVSITGYQGNPYVTYADGTIVQVDLQGAPVDRWSLDFTPDDDPFKVGDLLVYHTSDNAFVALSPDLREIVWRAENIPSYSRVQVSNALIAIVTERQDEILFYTHTGDLLDSADLRNGANMTTSSSGEMLVYTQGGLWTVDANGTWSERLADVPAGGGSGAVATLPDGSIYLLDGPNIYAYAPDGTRNWDARLPLEITGQSQMRPIIDDAGVGTGLLILSNNGDIVTVRAIGGICGFTQIYGDDRAEVWHEIGQDDVLRVAIGDQIIGIDWRQFAGSCAA